MFLRVKNTSRKVDHMIKGILFDFNGTMFFDSEKHKKAWNAFSLEYRNKPITDDEMDHMHGQTNKRIIEMLMPDAQLSDKKKEELSLAKEALYRTICLAEPESLHLVEGLPALLDSLKEAHMPMTICSASIKDNIDFFIKTFDLARWFRVEDIVYDDGLHQDKISMFMDGAKHIGVDIHDCLVIEDSISGIQFAKKAGVAKIIAITSQGKEDEYEKLEEVSLVLKDFLSIDINGLK